METINQLSWGRGAHGWVKEHFPTFFFFSDRQVWHHAPPPERGLSVFVYNFLIFLTIF